MKLKKLDVDGRVPFDERMEGIRKSLQFSKGSPHAK
jgi:hypothetical protein